MQWLATALFVIVFIQLFIALSLYLWKTLYDFFKPKKKPDPPSTEVESDSVKLHISEGLIEVSRLPDEHQQG